MSIVEKKLNQINKSIDKIKYKKALDFAGLF
jgi:hypothetical protein